MSETVDAALRTRMDEFDEAVLQRDAALAKQVLHPDYALVLVHPVPARMPRERWLAVLPDYRVSSWEVRDQVIDIDGDTASVLQWVEMQATVLGEDRSGSFIISDTWRRGPDGWQVWKRHSTPLVAGVMPGAS